MTSQAKNNFTKMLLEGYSKGLAGLGYDNYKNEVK